MPLTTTPSQFWFDPDLEQLGYAIGMPLVIWEVWFGLRLLRANPAVTADVDSATVVDTTPAAAR